MYATAQMGAPMWTYAAVLNAGQLQTIVERTVIAAPVSAPKPAKAIRVIASMIVWMPRYAVVSNAAWLRIIAEQTVPVALAPA
jgi:hypothetical protein